LLAELKTSDLRNEGDSNLSPSRPFIGVGLDSCVIPLRYHNLNLIQTTDFFYPLIDDPYTMGRIACCNVLSDLYAMGVDTCDNMLMLLGVSSLMSEDERKAAIPIMIKGFSECASEAGTSVQGGQTVVNPWLIIGGVATSVCPRENIIMPHNAQVGHVLVLTKPLGTQVAVNAYQWKAENTVRYETIKCLLTDDQIDELFERATVHMATLNRTGATLLHTHGAHACTDVTGFGLLGHATNLVESQHSHVDFIIDTLPCLRNAMAIDTALGGVMKLRRGLSPETSGGLLAAFSKDHADAFVQDMVARGGWACVIGAVTSGSRCARIAENAQIIDV